MQIGTIGLGRMGANIVRRLIRGRHECVVRDVSADAVRGLASEGAAGHCFRDWHKPLAPVRAMVPAPALISIYLTTIVLDSFPGVASP
jgi:6-phosphogluconate dehydrogenase